MDMHVSSSAYEIRLNGHIVRPAPSPFERINQAAAELVDVSDRLNRMCDGRALNFDRNEFGQLEAKYLEKIEALNEAIKASGIDPDTLRRAVEA